MVLTSAGQERQGLKARAYVCVCVCSAIKFVICWVLKVYWYYMYICVMEFERITFKSSLCVFNTNLWIKKNICTYIFFFVKTKKNSLLLFIIPLSLHFIILYHFINLFIYFSWHEKPLKTRAFDAYWYFAVITSTIDKSIVTIYYCIHEMALGTVRAVFTFMFFICLNIYFFHFHQRKFQRWIFFSF